MKEHSSAESDIGVDVAVGTYNQRTYVKSAMDSICRQQTSFPVRIVIADDCSSDGTWEILHQYILQSDGRIIGFQGEQHTGILSTERPYIRCLKMCSAKYVALLEGDDYWTDPLKLQKQVDYMEMHPEVSFCFHAVNVEYTDGRERLWGDVCGNGQVATIQMPELILTLPEVPTCSMLCRREWLRIPSWYHRVLNGDRVLQFLLVDRGPCARMSDTMAVHRKHAGGISRLYSTDRGYMRMMWVNTCRLTDRELDYRYHELFAEHIQGELWNLALESMQQSMGFETLVRWSRYVFWKRQGLLWRVRRCLQEVCRSYGVV